MLSPGKQQRLAFARALLFAPQWLYMDEATSAMDEEDEATLYKALIDELPGLSIVSVGHRSSLKRFHRAACAHRGRVASRTARGLKTNVGGGFAPIAVCQSAACIN